MLSEQVTLVIAMRTNCGISFDLNYLIRFGHADSEMNNLLSTGSWTGALLRTRILPIFIPLLHFLPHHNEDMDNYVINAACLLFVFTSEDPCLRIFHTRRIPDGYALFPRVDSSIKR